MGPQKTWTLTVIGRMLRLAPSHRSTHLMHRELLSRQRHNNRLSPLSPKLIHFLPQGKLRASHPVVSSQPCRPVRVCPAIQEHRRKTTNHCTTTGTVLNKSSLHRPKRPMSRSASKCSNLSNMTDILFPRLKPNQHSRPRASQVVTHPLRMTCPPITLRTTRGMLIKTTATMEITASNRSRVHKIALHLSREEEALLAPPLRSRALNIPQAELNHSPKIVTLKLQKLKPAEIQRQTLR